MNAKLGWALAVVGVALGYFQFGWRGVALAVSAIVFWLLLQFTRALRAMRTAGGAPVGVVASAVMLQAKLQKGHRLMDVILLTRSLGHKLSDEPETYRWQDPSDAAVTVVLQGGRVTEWTFTRPAEPAAGAAAGQPAGTGT
jgi:hypothetical protein